MASKYRIGQKLNTRFGVVEVVKVERRVHGNTSWITIATTDNGQTSEMRMSTNRLTKWLLSASPESEASE